MFLITWHDLLRQCLKVIKHHEVTQLACQFELLPLKWSLLFGFLRAPCASSHAPQHLRIWMGSDVSLQVSVGTDSVALSQDWKGKASATVKLDRRVGFQGMCENSSAKGGVNKPFPMLTLWWRSEKPRKGTGRSKKGRKMLLLYCLSCSQFIQRDTAWLGRWGNRSVTQTWNPQLFLHAPA